MSRPRLLDLFCGPGGASVGYARSGFEVVGVDLSPQHDYPFEFIQGDALEFLAEEVAWTQGPRFAPKAFDAIHASPPCQRWTRMQRQRKNQDAHPDLITPLRPLLDATGLPYVIENVEGCDALIDPVMICGSMFDPPMEIRHHRLFETNWNLIPPMWPCRHDLYALPLYPGTPNGSGNRPGARVMNPMASGTTHEMWAAAKGIDWIPANGRKRPSPALNDALPPLYTEFVGRQLMVHIACVQAA